MGGRGWAGQRRARTLLAAGVLTTAFVLATSACGGSGVEQVDGPGYQAVFPSRAARVTTEERVAGRPVPVVTYLAGSGSETDAISSSPSAGGLVGPAVVRRLDAAVAGSARSVAGQVLTERRLRWLGLPAVDATIATTDRLIQERLVIDAGRLVLIEGISKGVHPTFAGFRTLLRTFRLQAGGPAPHGTGAPASTG